MRVITIPRIRSMLTSCWLLTAVGSVPVLAAGTEGGVAASLRLESDVVSIHEPVLATLQIENKSEHAVRFDLGLDHKYNLTFVFTQPDSTRVTKRLQIYFDEFGEIGIVTLGRGQSYSQGLILNDWLNFDQKGVYEIRLDLPPLEGAAFPQVAPVVAVAHLQVTSRDPARLATVCNQLETKALSRIPKTSNEAAHALRFATDEACRPSLSKLLKATDDWIKIEAIDGLASLGTAAAVAAVVDAWDGFSPNAQMAALGRLGTALRDALQRSGKKVAER
jgi:hypothetical protein